MLFFRFIIIPLFIYIALVIVRSAFQPKKREKVNAKPTVPQAHNVVQDSFPVNTETPMIQDATFEDLPDKTNN